MKKLLIPITILLSVICFDAKSKYDPDAFFTIQYWQIPSRQNYWIYPDFNTVEYCKDIYDAEGIDDSTYVYQDKNQ